MLANVRQLQQKQWQRWSGHRHCHALATFLLEEEAQECPQLLAEQ